MTVFNLYHYSEQRYDALKSKHAQQDLKPPNKVIVDYEYHISFFLEPIPLDILPAIHNHKHNFYKEGNPVYEYIIPTSNLKGLEFEYRLTESPEKIKLLYDDSISDAEYYKLIEKINNENKYTGKDIAGIEENIMKYRGTTRELFKKIPSYPNYKSDLITKYSPCVPHFMIYFKEGIVEYKSVTLKHFGNPSKKENQSLITKW